MLNYGEQRGRLVACSASEHHGFHPENESCAWCSNVSKVRVCRSWDWYAAPWGQQLYESKHVGSKSWEELGATDQEYFQNIACRLVSRDRANDWLRPSPGQLQFLSRHHPHTWELLDEDQRQHFERQAYLEFLQAKALGTVPRWWPDA